MTDKTWPFEWRELHARLEAARLEHAKMCEPLVWYFGPASEFCKRIIADGRSPANGPRPQDHLAVGMSIRAFRTALASVELSLAGYADTTAALNRSIWELQLRLSDVRQHGLLAALACLLHEAEQEVAAYEYEAANGEHKEGYLEAWTGWRDELRERATTSGFSIDELKRHGKLNFKVTAAASAQTDAYKTLYVRHSLAAHGASSAAHYASLSSAGAVREEGGILLPLESYVVDMIGDALTQLFLCLSYAAEIVGDLTLANDVIHALNHLQEHWRALSPDLGTVGAV